MSRRTLEIEIGKKLAVEHRVEEASVPAQQSRAVSARLDTSALTLLLGF